MSNRQLYEPVNEEAFRQAIRVMLGVERRGYDFDIGHWTSDMVDPKAEEVPAPTCETSACAIGWCCYDAWFERQGLSFRLDGRHRVIEPTLPDPDGRSALLGGWPAVERFFNITNAGACLLFTGAGYRGDNATPLMVARKLGRALRTSRAAEWRGNTFIHSIDIRRRIVVDLSPWPAERRPLQRATPDDVRGVPFVRGTLVTS